TVVGEVQLVRTRQLQWLTRRQLPEAQMALNSDLEAGRIGAKLPHHDHEMIVASDGQWPSDFASNDPRRTNPIWRRQRLHTMTVSLRIASPLPSRSTDQEHRSNGQHLNRAGMCEAV